MSTWSVGDWCTYLPIIVGAVLLALIQAVKDIEGARAPQFLKRPFLNYLPLLLLILGGAAFLARQYGPIARLLDASMPVVVGSLQSSNSNVAANTALADFESRLSAVKRERDAAISERDNLRRQLNSLSGSTPIDPYDLSESQIHNLADDIFSIKNDLSPAIEIQRTMNDSPSMSLSVALGRAFDMASIQPVYNWGRPTTPKDLGIKIRVADLKNIPDGAKKLAAALDKAGLHSSFEILAGTAPEKFILFVGPKP